MFNPESELQDKYVLRREMVFIIIAGLFLGSLAMLNILGVSRLIDLSFTIGGVEVPFILFVGVLPYPITFLCTDFLSEIYGKKRANMVVWVGLILNLWVLFVIWLGGSLPPHPEIIPETGLPELGSPDWTFFKIKQLTFGATAASMIAYLTAQFVDVHIFHTVKHLTKGKHLWLRNNVSTMVSQMVDSISVVLITYYVAHAFEIEEGKVASTLVVLILSGYIFKFIAALLDTFPFYIGVKYLSKYLNIDPNSKFKTKEKFD